MRPVRTILPILLCLLMSSVDTAEAASWHRLAYSKKMGADVFVGPDGSDWCAKTVKSKVKLDSGSPLRSGGVKTFLGKVLTVIRNDCPEAAKADFSVVDADGEASLGNYVAESSSNWKVVKGGAPVIASASSEKFSKTVRKDSALPKGPVKATYLGLVSGVLQGSASTVDSDDFVKDYIVMEHYQEFRRIRKNEIGIAKMMDKYREEAREFYHAAAPEYIELRIDGKLGKYDVKKEAFEFSPINKDAGYVLDRPSKWWNHRMGEAFPKKIGINVFGGEAISRMGMAESRAEKLLKRLRYRRVDIVAVVKVVSHDTYPGTSLPKYRTQLHSLKVLENGGKKVVYEYPASWVGAKVAKLREEKRRAQRERQKRLETERRRKEAEEAARQERIERGVEPIAASWDVVKAHYDKLRSGKNDSYMVNGVDTRRPLLIASESEYMGETVIFGDGLIPELLRDKEIAYVVTSDEGDERIKLKIQNWREFREKSVPEAIQSDLRALLKEYPNAFTKMGANALYKAKARLLLSSVGYGDDPWKGGKTLVLHVDSAKYEAKLRRSSAKEYCQWEVKAEEPKKPYIQKRDRRTARQLDLAGLHGGMELEEVEDVLEERFGIKAEFDEQTKLLESTSPISLSEYNSFGDALPPGRRYFKGRFVKTGESLMGLGGPVYSLKQAMLRQTATKEEKEAIVDGLIKKFGEPDLRMVKGGVLVFNWGERITDDRSKMPSGKNISRPVSALEAQIHQSMRGVVTTLILTDELYLKKTKVETQTIY